MPTAFELWLVAEYKRGFINLSQLWSELEPDRVVFICMMSGIPFPTDQLINELFPELNDDGSLED